MYREIVNSMAKRLGQGETKNMSNVKYHNTAILGPDRTGEEYPIIEMEITLEKDNGNADRLRVRFFHKEKGTVAKFKECVRYASKNEVKLSQEIRSKLNDRLLGRGYCETVVYE